MRVHMQTGLNVKHFLSIHGIKMKQRLAFQLLLRYLGDSGIYDTLHSSAHFLLIP